MPDKDKQEESKPSTELYGQKIGNKYLVGGQANIPLTKKTKLSLGANKIIGEKPGVNTSIKLSKETKGGGEFSLGYNSGRNFTAEYTNPKGRTISASYNPMGGAMVSAKIRLGKLKNK